MGSNGNRNKIKGSLSGLDKMNRLFKKCANNRGKSTEKYVEEALKALQQEGKIISFYLTKKWSHQDKSGIDAVVYLLDGTEIKCQIKSSVAGIKKHIAEKKKRGGDDIKGIYGYYDNEDFEEYKERIYRNITE